MGQLLLPSDLIWTGYHQVPLRIWPEHLGKGFDQQVATFLGMNSPHGQRQSFIPQLRIATEEFSLVQLRIAVWFGEAIVDYDLVAAIEPGRRASQYALFFRGDTYGSARSARRVVR